MKNHFSTYYTRISSLIEENLFIDQLNINQSLGIDGIYLK